MKIIASVVAVVSVACAPRAVPVAVPRLAPEVLAARLSEADRLASRGCYLCLKEAAAAYAALLAESDDSSLLTKALENDLMLAIREIELRLPDSGAREHALQLQDQAGSSCTAYFAALDAFRPAGPVYVVRGEPLSMKQERDERLKLVTELEQDASASPMKAYFFIALLVQLQQFKDVKAQIDAILAAHPQDLSLKYRMLAFQPTYSGEAARDLIGQETGF